MSSVNSIPDHIKRLFLALITGGVLGFSEIVYAISLGSLVFSGLLVDHLPQGIGMALIASAITMVVIALTSSISGVIGGTQDSSTVLLALIASSLAEKLTLANPSALFPTVMVTITLTTLLTGLCLWVMGIFRLGEMVRFVPFPVIGGFLAGTGWLLAQGSIGTMADFPLTFASLPDLLQPDQLLLWAPGVFFALVLFLGMRHIHHFLAMPGLLAGLMASFYLGLLVTGTSIARAKQMGLLIGNLGEVNWHFFDPSWLAATDWGAVLGQSGNIFAVLSVVLLSLLMNASGIELATKQDIDINRELRVSGLSNMLSGVGGGIIGYHTLSMTALTHRIGTRGRLPGVMAGLLCGAIIFSGASVLAFFPKALLGGLLLFLGLDFLVEWVIEARSRFSLPEYSVVLIILIAIAATNFLIGVGVGLMMIVVMFVINYSRVNVIHHALSGLEMRSNVERTMNHRQILEQYGPQIYVLELQGYIFFGTANSLLERIRLRIKDALRPPVRYILLDFQRVTGLDSSATLSFSKARDLAAERKIYLILTSVPIPLRKRLALSGLDEDGDHVMFFQDADRGLQWCEDMILGSTEIGKMELPDTLIDQMALEGFNPDQAARLLPYLNAHTIEAGETLIRQDDPESGLYIIETGQVSVLLEVDGGHEPMRLRTMGKGTVVGEMGFYMCSTRTASVIADAHTVAYHLTQESLDRMTCQDPDLAAAFHKMIACLLSERLAMTTRSLWAMHKPDIE